MTIIFGKGAHTIMASVEHAEIVVNEGDFREAFEPAGSLPRLLEVYAKRAGMTVDEARKHLGIDK